MRWLWSWVKGGADELGWDDVIRRVSKAIADTAHFGARGAISFPPEVEVTLEVAGAGEAEVARDFLQRPGFDREVATQLVNRCDCAASDLPVRTYQVEEGERLAVRVAARSIGAVRWVLRVEGGDLDGETLELPAGRAEFRFGRGPWHGGDKQVANDLVVSESCAFISRRAGRLIASGHVFEVEALDQGDLLSVRRANGDALRPARAASGRASLSAADAIELKGGTGEQVRLYLERRHSASTEAG